MSEKTKNRDIAAVGATAWVWVSLFILAVGAYFAGLDMALVGPDEPRYAQVAREMFQRGDWITPTLGGYHWFEKPALLYWLQFASYSVFGVTEFAARLGSAFFGLGTVASLWLLGNVAEIGCDRQGLGKWLALISASTLGVIVFAHGATFDIIVTFPLTAAMVCFFAFDQSNTKDLRTSTLPLIFFYVFIGLSLLAKGLIGIIFPFAIVAFYHLISWKMPNRRFLISVVWGSLLAFIVAAPWYWPMYLRHGWEFIDEFFLQHHFQRFTSNKYQHPQPFYFFLWVLPLMTIPWLPFFVAALISQIRKLVASCPREAGSPLRRFVWAWLLVPLVFFSLSGSKLPGYILPALPAAIVLAGTYVYRLVSKSVKWRNAVMGLAGITFVAVIAAAFTIAPRFANEDSVKPLIDAVNGHGHTEKSVLMFLRITHSAEFYASGRLVRDKEGKLLRIASKDELLRELNKVGGSAVVLAPREYTSQLTGATEIETEVIASNDEFNVAVVKLRN